MTQRSTLGFTATPTSLLRSLEPTPALSVTPPTYYLTRQRVAMYLVAPDRVTRWRIGQWSAVSAGKELHDVGPMVLTAPANAAWIGAARSASSFDVTGAAWERFSFDVYVDGWLEWSGPIVNCQKAPGAALHGHPRVTLTAETWLTHFARRSANWTMAKTAVDVTNQADDIIRDGFRNANGAVTPTGYPGGLSRSDYGPGWTLNVESDTGSAASMRVGEQEGKNLWAFVQHVAEKGDCYIFTLENPPGTWTVAVRAPYQASDLTGAIRLRPGAGSLRDYTTTESIEDLLNIFAVKGDGTGEDQVKGFDHDAGSYAARGKYEGEVTIPSATNTTLQAELDAILARQAGPLTLVTADIRSTADANFVFHRSSGTPGEYGQRDKVSIALPQVATVATAVVKGWKIEQSGGSPWRVAATLGDWRASIGKQAALFVGPIGPFSAGSRFRNSGS